MARQIKLRYDATCYDCDRQLSAGSYGRWFGKGRVTCPDGSGCREDEQEASAAQRSANGRKPDVTVAKQPRPLNQPAPAAKPVAPQATAQNMRQDTSPAAAYLQTALIDTIDRIATALRVLGYTVNVEVKPGGTN